MQCKSQMSFFLVLLCLACVTRNYLHLFRVKLFVAVGIFELGVINHKRPDVVTVTVDLELALEVVAGLDFSEGSTHAAVELQQNLAKTKSLIVCNLWRLSVHLESEVRRDLLRADQLVQRIL